MSKRNKKPVEIQITKSMSEDARRQLTDLLSAVSPRLKEAVQEMSVAMAETIRQQEELAKQLKVVQPFRAFDTQSGFWYSHSYPASADLPYFQPEDYMYSVVMQLKQPLPPNTRISMRSVSNIDLTESGGYSLLGEFVSHYKKADGSLMEAHSNTPLVLMASHEDVNGIRHRAAILFVPNTPLVSTKLSAYQFAELKAFEEKLLMEVSVKGNGIIFGIYNEADRYIPTSDTMFGVPETRNTYYQVALDLSRLMQMGLVQFESNAGVYLHHDMNTSLHNTRTLPPLPHDLKWGPEIAGVLTVQRRSDPYTLELPFMMMDYIFSNMPATFLRTGNGREDWLEFLKDQADRLGKLTKSYEVMAKVYKEPPIET